MPNRDIASGESDTITGETDVAAPWAISGEANITGEANVIAEQWLVDNTRLRVTSVTLTPTRLTLGVVARDAEARAQLQTLDDNAGNVRERPNADGTVDGIDTSGGNNTFEIIPPQLLVPPRTRRDWVVEDVNRERTSADTQAIEGSVEFVNRKTRDPVTGHIDPSDATAWTFDFGSAGTIVTPRVGVTEQSATTQLRLLLAPTQAELWETQTAAAAGAVVTNVPDGEAFTRDTTPEGRQTVTVTPPSGASDPAVPQGDYVIEGWESSGSTGGRVRVLAELSSRYEP